MDALFDLALEIIRKHATRTVCRNCAAVFEREAGESVQECPECGEYFLDWEELLRFDQQAFDMAKQELPNAEHTEVIARAQQIKTELKAKNSVDTV